MLVIRHITATFFYGLAILLALGVDVLTVVGDYIQGD